MSSIEWRDQVAKAVRSVKIVSGAGGGTCFHRAATGAKALGHLGLKPRIVVGSMVYRVGLDDVLDVVAFCGQGNAAQVPNLFHVWLEVDDNIVDFASGDWRPDSNGITEFSKALPTEANLRPIAWQVTPPEYIWAPKEHLTKGWNSTGTPDLGVMWYHEGVRGTEADKEQVIAYLRGGMDWAMEDVNLLWPRVRHLLPERVEA